MSSVYECSQSRCLVWQICSWAGSWGSCSGWRRRSRDWTTSDIGLRHLDHDWTHSPVDVLSLRVYHRHKNIHHTCVKSCSSVTQFCIQSTPVINMSTHGDERETRACVWRTSRDSASPRSGRRRCVWYRWQMNQFGICTVWSHDRPVHGRGRTVRCKDTQFAVNT